MSVDTAGSPLHAAVARLVLGRDGEAYVLGRPDLGLYVVVPEPGAVLVAALQNGATLDEATARASEVAGEEVDGVDFVTGLGEAGLFETGTGPGSGTGRPIRWVEAVSPRTARLLFGPAAWIGYGLAAAFVVAVLVLRPDLRPTFEDVWFLPDPAAALLVFVPVGAALTALHEMWHWLAGRALGIAAVFRVSRRGVFLVFETDLTQIVTTPRRRRYVAYVAGACVDGVALAAALAARLAYREGVLGLPPVLDRVLGVVVLALVTSISWQVTAVCLRNDGYAVLANALRCHNLYRATWLTTKDRLFHLSDAEAEELAAIGDHDRRVARWFGVTYLASLLGMVWLALSFAVPSLIGLAMWTWRSLTSVAVTTLSFWESAALLLLLAAQAFGPALLARRERRARSERRLL
jgi:putative peptide zinc metalloprotease protein